MRAQFVIARSAARSLRAQFVIARSDATRRSRSLRNVRYLDEIAALRSQ